MSAAARENLVMDDEKRRLRDEVADLAEAVRDLRAQLAQRGHDHGHCCLHWHYTPVPYYPQPTIYQPYVVTSGGGTICGGGGGGSGTFTSIGSGTSTASGPINYS